MGRAREQRRRRALLEMLKDAALLVIGAVLVMVVPLMFVDAARDLRASNGEGNPGTMVVEGEECSSSRYSFSCRSRGTWTSDDGLTVLEDMVIEVGQYPMGETVPGRVLVDEGDGGAVYPLGYSRGVPAWAWSFLYVPMGTVFIVIGALGVRDWRVTSKG